MKLRNKSVERAAHRLRAWLVLHDPIALQYLEVIRAKKQVPYSGWTLAEYCELLRVRLYAQYQADESSKVNSIGLLQWMYSYYPAELVISVQALKAHRGNEEPDEMKAAWVLRDFIHAMYPAAYRQWSEVPRHG